MGICEGFEAKKRGGVDSQTAALTLSNDIVFLIHFLLISRILSKFAVRLRIWIFPIVHMFAIAFAKTK